MYYRPIYWQSLCVLPAQPRGFHLITDSVNDCFVTLPTVEIGIAHLFLQHTSCSLAISENTCADVPTDLENFFNRIIPDDKNLYHHVFEGADDMPAHIKNIMLGVSVTIPIRKGKLALGRWQGIYLCEHRNQATARSIVMTVHGCILDKKAPPDFSCLVPES